MSVERELKFAIAEHDSLRRLLIEIGGHNLSAAALEDNWVFDRDGEQRDGGTLLRLRTDGQGSRLTWKGPTEWQEKVKVRVEHEVEVADAEATRAILEALGYGVIRHYQKVREEWRLEDTVLALDQTPIGLFVEIEGEEPEKVALRCGLDPASAESRSYLRLYADYRRQHPDSPAEMVFP